MANFKGDTQVIKTMTSPLAEEMFVTAEGVRGADSLLSLLDGDAGVMLFDDHALRDNIIRLEHGRTPQPEVNPGATIARGVFTAYETQCDLTKALFVQDAGTTTPVFARFANGSGTRGSSDCTRDPREFTVRFFTADGHFDLVGSNVPVSFVQDALTPSELMRAIRAESRQSVPHTSAAHDAFWNFVARSPESTHALLWAMSDRAIPRSFAMMEGFGVHAFRCVNAEGKASLVRFHWKPLLGVHSLVWDEAMKLATKDADFHRRHLWELIERGHFPEWELGVQVVAEEDRHKFDFDLCDATKLIPQSLVPVRSVGKLTLNQNPDNYFAELEQVVFHSQHLVAGIESIDNSHMKKFSYSDAKVSRLCSTHFNELSLDRSRAMLERHRRETQLRSFSNGEQSDGKTTAASVENPPSSYWSGAHVANDVMGDAKNSAGDLSSEHYWQATLFWRSQSVWEQNHIVAAFCFELAKVSVQGIRAQVVAQLAHVDANLASRVADGLGLPSPGINVSSATSTACDVVVEPSLSMASARKDLITGRCVAVLVANGFERDRLTVVMAMLAAGGASVKILASRLGEVKCSRGLSLNIDHSLAAVGSVMFDAVYIPGGQRSVESLCKDANAVLFVKEAYKHGKGIAASNEGGMLITRAARSSVMSDVFKGPGVITIGPNASTDEFVSAFVAAVANHRFNERPDMNGIVA